MARAPFPHRGTGCGAEAHPDLFPPLLSSLVAALPGPLLVLDREERVALASPAAGGLFGDSAESLVGRQATALFPDGFAQPAARGIRSCGALLRVEIARRQMLHDGKPLTLLWLEDVTESRRSEETLKRDVAHLEEATRAKSEFVASMSHEIRTPMNAVLGMTDILLESDLDTSQRELAERVRRAGMNLMTTLNDVLDLAKVEAGRLEIEARSFPLRPWLHEAVELFGAQTRKKGLALVEHVDAAVPEILQGDAPRLRQILVNLIGNAVKFTTAGQISVSVSLAEPDGDLVFSIRDTGIGIDPEHLDRLFEPWAQARSSTAREYGGAGLGLSIARQLAERMGGSIEATSKPGTGSAFRFRMPIESKKSAHRAAVSAQAGQNPPSRAQRLA